MPLPSMSSARASARNLGAAIAATALLTGATACSSDAESDGAADTSADSKSTAGKSQGAPDGFPQEVPLPKAEKIDVIKSGEKDDVWSLVVTVDATLKTTGESLTSAYQQQLEDAGFEVDESTSEPIEAEKGDWEVGYRSAMDGTLTISAMKD